MELSIIFRLVAYSIKLILKELMPYIQLISLIVRYIQPISCGLLLFVLVEIIIMVLKKSKKPIRPNNSVYKKIETSKSTICSECGRQVNSNIKYCPHCGNQLKQTNISLIFTGISLLINPIGIFSIISIVFGIKQLTDPNNNTEKSWTIVSIVTSILFVLLWLLILRKNYILLLYTFTNIF